MIDLGEHIEELIKINKREGLPNDPMELGQSALDIACDQGLISVDDAGTDLAAKQARDQAAYLLGVD